MACRIRTDGFAVMTNHTPVLIAGAGPIGLALAGDLAWRGIRSVVVERGDGVITQPKMDLLGPRTMEFCRRWGLEETVRNCPYNQDQPQDCVWLESLTGYEFGREVFPTPHEEQPPPQSPVKRERCPQDMFDPILKRWVETLPDVTLRYHTELTSFDQQTDRVVATLRNSADGDERIEADYLIGADGGASTVRQALGIEMLGQPTLTYTTNAIFRCKNFWDLHDKKKGYRFIFIGPEGTWSTLVAIDGYDRYRFSVVGDENRRILSEVEIRALIVRAMGKEFEFEILSIVPWVRRELIAKKYGHDRVFIAGDAAHLNSPTGAFGMNTGMQDSVDLGWKLAAALQGWGGDDLLASYEAERRPVAIQNIQEATNNLQRMISPRKQLSPQVFEPGADGDAARRTFGEAYTKMMKYEWFTLPTHLGYRYDASPVIISDGTPPPDDPPMVYTQTARPGSRAPHVWLADGRSTLDLFGKGFVLLRFDPRADASPLEIAARRHHMPLSVIDLDHDEARSLYVNRLVLVRPDGFVAWRGDSLPSDSSAIVDVVRGVTAERAAISPIAIKGANG